MNEFKCLFSFDEAAVQFEDDIKKGNFNPRYWCTIPLIRELYKQDFQIEEFLQLGTTEGKWLIEIDLSNWKNNLARKVFC